MGLWNRTIKSEAERIVNSELEPLAQQADRALIAFLRAELQLGFTYANTARVEQGFDAPGERRARQLAKGVLETIERFRGRIADPAIQVELQESMANLEKLLASPQPPTPRRSPTP